MAVKTGFDLLDVLNGYLDPGPLASAITGRIYQYSRPMNSGEEDVVLNTLALDNEQIQTGVTNLNLYVPGLEIVTEAGAEVVPDVERMKTLAMIAAGLLRRVIIGDYEFQVQQPPLLVEDQNTGEYYFNIRMQWNNLNF